MPQELPVSLPNSTGMFSTSKSQTSSNLIFVWPQKLHQHPNCLVNLITHQKMPVLFCNPTGIFSTSKSWASSMLPLLSEYTLICLYGHQNSLKVIAHQWMPVSQLYRDVLHIKISSMLTFVQPFWPLNLLLKAWSNNIVNTHNNACCNYTVNVLHLDFYKMFFVRKVIFWKIFHARFNFVHFTIAQIAPNYN